MIREAASPERRPIVVAAALFGAVLAASLAGWARALSWPITEMVFHSPGPTDFVHDVGGGLAFGIAGLVLWWRRPGNVTGPLMVLIGAALLSWVFEFLPVPPVVTLGQLAAWGPPTVLIGALLLLYPTGRIRSRLEFAWMAGAAVLLVVGAAQVLVTPIGKWACAECHSWVVLSYDENVSNDMWLIAANLRAVLAVALVLLLVRRWVAASPPTRRVMAPLWIAGVAFGLVAFAHIMLDTSGFSPNIFSDIPNVGAILRLQVPPVLWTAMPYLATGALLLVPLSLLWGQVRSRWGQLAVSSLAIQLSRTDGRLPLVDSLRQALGDSSLELALWSRPARAYVTPDGLPFTIPDGRASRAVTRLDGDEGPLAAIIHDPALSEQGQLIGGVSAVAQLALENERLHAELKAQLEQVRASRQRIVSAADEERRRMERNIHDGAQQRLVSLSLALGVAQARAAEASPEIAASLAEAEAELRHAIGELRELARGIHPAILTEAGLGPALESLAERTGVPVAVQTRLNGRLPPVVEATAYFVAAEALTNVAKHARASAATLSARIEDGWLRVRIVDNGVGGADPERGTGLRGLEDRVSALGGTLRVEGDPAGGTQLEAEIPCA